MADSDEDSLDVEVYPFAINHGRTYHSEADALTSTLWPPHPEPEVDRIPEAGRVKPPYGGVKTCRNSTCGRELSEEHGAYLHSNSETGKIFVLCGPCSMNAQMYDSLRYPLVAL